MAACPRAAASSVDGSVDGSMSGDRGTMTAAHPARAATHSTSDVMSGCWCRRSSSTCSSSRSSRCSTAWPSRSSAGTRSTRRFHFIGLGNFQELFADPVFWQAAVNTAVLVVAGVTIQLFIGTALAIFFDLQLRGAWFVRGVLILPMLLTPVVVGLMWRAHAQSRLGHGQLRARRAGPATATLAGRPEPGAGDAHPRGLLAVGALHHGHRLRAPAGAAA